MVMERLRLSSEMTTGADTGEMHRGLPGALVTDTDASHARITPLRPYQPGEIVAWRDTVRARRRRRRRRGTP